MLLPQSSSISYFAVDACSQLLAMQQVALPEPCTKPHRFTPRCTLYDDLDPSMARQLCMWVLKTAAQYHDGGLIAEQAPDDHTTFHVVLSALLNGDRARSVCAHQKHAGSRVGKHSRQDTQTGVLCTCICICAPCDAAPLHSRACR